MAIAAPCRLRSGEALLSRSAAGDAVDPRHDALYFVAEGRVRVSHDPQQSTGGRLLFGGDAASRRTSRAFRLAELGPGSVIGLQELATRRRCAGVFAAAAPCALFRLSFLDIDALAASDPPLHAALFQLVAAHLCDAGERTKGRLASLVDALYAKPLRDPVPRATLRSIARYG